MSTRIAKHWSQLADRNEKALVAFVTAGDPNMTVSRQILEALARAQVDIVELGVPFSDPTADGPVIQRSSQRSLAQGTSMAHVLRLCREMRSFSEIPIVIFSYYNPILAYGPSRFHDDAVSAGADGLLVVDLPPEESDELLRSWDEPQLDLIRLVAPTTPTARMHAIAERGSGFLYLVSMAGVTGSSGLDVKEVDETLARLKSVTSLPVCVGFGISTPEHVAAVCRRADGAVVGSGFERLIEENLNDPALPATIQAYASSLKAATRNRSPY